MMATFFGSAMPYVTSQLTPSIGSSCILSAHPRLPAVRIANNSRCEVYGEEVGVAV
jgi:hypothetical protein